MTDVEVDGTIPNATPASRAADFAGQFQPIGVLVHDALARSRRVVGARVVPRGFQGVQSEHASVPVSHSLATLRLIHNVKAEFNQLVFVDVLKV